MTMTAKYNSICRKCKGPIGQGQQIEWSREHGPQHATCPAKATRPAGDPLRPFHGKFPHLTEAHDKAQASVGAEALDAEHAAITGSRTPAPVLSRYREALKKVTTDPARSSWFREAARVLDLGDPRQSLADAKLLLRLQELRQESAR